MAVATLGALTFGFRPLPDWGKPSRQFQLSGNPQADLPAQISESANAPRVLAFEAVFGSEDGDVYDNLHALELEVAKDSNTFVLQPSAGAPYAVTFKVLKNDAFALPFTPVFDARGYAVVPVSLTAEPWAYGAPVTVAHQHVATPAILALDETPGTSPAPYTLTIEREWTGGSNPMNQVVCALLDADLDLADVLYEAEDGTGWTLTSESHAHGSGNNCRHTYATDPSGGIDWSHKPPAGRYRAFCVARIDAACSSGHLGLGLDGGASIMPWETVVTENDWTIYELGDVALDGTNAPTLWGYKTGGSSGDFIWADFLLLVPLDKGGAWYYSGSQNVQSLAVTHRTATVTHIVGGSANAARNLEGHGFLAAGTPRILVYARDLLGTQPAPTVTVTETHTPRHWHWPRTP